MTASAVWQAVYARYLADTGSGGLNHASAPIITGLYINQAPERQAAPYVVFNVQNESHDDSLGSSFVRVDCAFNVYVNKETADPASVVPIRDRLKALFNRWTASGVTGYTFTAMQRVGSLEIPTPDQLAHFADEYTVKVSGSTT